jgi:hypothetical protein
MAKKWYAVLMDFEDKDFGKGSFDREEAVLMAERIGGQAHVAVIEAADEPVCIEKIYVNGEAPQE